MNVQAIVSDDLYYTVLPYMHACTGQSPTSLQQDLFSKCDVCVKFSQERLKVVGQKHATEVLRAEFRAHLDLVE